MAMTVTSGLIRARTTAMINAWSMLLLMMSMGSSTSWCTSPTALSTLRTSSAELRFRCSAYGARR